MREVVTDRALAQRIRPATHGAAAVSLSAFVRSGHVSKRHANEIMYAISAGEHILVCGPSGSGKTLFCQALINELVASLRPSVSLQLNLIERTPELCCAIESHGRFSYGVAAPVLDALRGSRRLDPDVVIVDGLDGADAFDVLTDSQCGGAALVATACAEPGSAMTDLARLVDAHPLAQGLGGDVVRSAVDVCVQMNRVDGGLRVMSVERY
jgi:Flp pilus assembly CpaF family ATPase